MKVGIVGKPNVGKSAFFRALTLAKAESGNFPFTTIDANSGIGFVKIEDPAKDFGKTSNPKSGFVKNGFRFVPIEIVDVAGLVPGASDGVGLGNKFLDDLRQADCLIHVIDLSGSVNEKGESCSINNYDPRNDIIFLEDEINKWFYNVLSKNFEKISKKIKLTDTKIDDAIFSIVSGLNVNLNQINLVLENLKITKENLEENLVNFCNKLREITKPMIISANKCDILIDDDLYKTKIQKLRDEFKNYIIIETAAEYEFNLKKAEEVGLIEYNFGDDNFKIPNKTKLNEVQIKGLEKIQNYLDKVKNTGVQKCLNEAVFNLLKLKPIFPGGVSKLEDKEGRVLPDCFLMEEKATALDFAYKLHTDFGKNFIKAIDVKTKKLVGKEHILKPLDIIEIVSSK